MNLSSLTSSFSAGINSFKSTLATGQAAPASQTAAAPQAQGDHNSVNWGTYSGAAPTAAAAPLNGPQSASLHNQVQMTKYYENGSQTAMQAVLPGMLGGGSLLPAPMLIQAHTNAQGQIQGDVTAEFLDKSGKPLVGPDGQVDQIHGGPAPDGNFYFATDKKNPNAPLAVFSEDGTYGITTLPQASATIPGAFTRDRMETIDPNGERVMKFNETIGAAPPQAPGLGGGMPGIGAALPLLAGSLGMPGAGMMAYGLMNTLGHSQQPQPQMQAQPGATPQLHHYTEARVDPNGAISASVVSETLLPGQKSAGSKMDLGSLFKQASPFGGGPSRTEAPLEAHMGANGALEATSGSFTSKLFSAYTGHGNWMQQSAAQQGGPGEYRPFSTTELATADGAAAVYQTVADELKHQPG